MITEVQPKIYKCTVFPDKQLKQIKIRRLVHIPAAIIINIKYSEHEVSVLSWAPLKQSGDRDRLAKEYYPFLPIDNLCEKEKSYCSEQLLF